MSMIFQDKMLKTGVSITKQLVLGTVQKNQEIPLKYVRKKIKTESCFPVKKQKKLFGVDQARKAIYRINFAEAKRSNQHLLPSKQEIQALFASFVMKNFPISSGRLLGGWGMSLHIIKGIDSGLGLCTAHVKKKPACGISMQGPIAKVLMTVQCVEVNRVNISWRAPGDRQGIQTRSYNRQESEGVWLLSQRHVKAPGACRGPGPAGRLGPWGPLWSPPESRHVRHHGGPRLLQGDGEAVHQMSNERTVCTWQRTCEKTVI